MQLTEQFRTQVTEKLEVVKQSSTDEVGGVAIANQMDKVVVDVGVLKGRSVTRLNKCTMTLVQLYLKLINSTDLICY